jgi:hypothetical protein
VGLLDYIRDALAFGATKRSWKDTDPRYQYQPGKMESAHVAPVPSFKTREEAQAWAQRDLGGLPLSFTAEGEQRRFPGTYPWEGPRNEAADVQAFRNAAEPLARAYKAGVRFPSSLFVEGERTGSDFENGTADMGFYRPSDSSVRLNRYFLRNRNQDVVDDTVLHELGHRADDRHRFNWQLPSERATARQLGPYAALHPDEFVASTYANGARGVELPQGVADLYGQMKGPPIPRLLPRGEP